VAQIEPFSLVAQIEPLNENAKINRFKFFNFNNEVQIKKLLVIKF